MMHVPRSLALGAAGAALLGCLLAASPASAQTSAATPAANAAEIEFWATVKETRNPAEMKAYLDTFPNGTFAALARARLKSLEDAQTPAAQRPALAAQPAQAPSDANVSAMTSPAIIREIQAKLYNLNYTVGAQNGVATAETRDAIRRWQSVAGRAQTGDISNAELALLRRAIVPTVWGAVAYNVQGGAGTVWGRATRADAEAAAIATCRNQKGGDCRVLAAADTGCGSLAHAQGVRGGTQYRGTYGVIRPTLAQAIDSALSDCRSQSRVGNNCGIRNSFCADGSHKR